MKTFIFLFAAIVLNFASVKAADFNPPEYIHPEDQQALVKLPEPLTLAAYHYLAHGIILDKTLRTCQQYRYFMDVISQDMEVDEVNLWQTPQFKQQVTGGFSPQQMKALDDLANHYAKYLAKNADIRTAVPIKDQRTWCEYKGTILFKTSIQKIYSTHYQNYVVKKDAWVQATQDLSMLVVE